MKTRSEILSWGSTPAFNYRHPPSTTWGDSTGSFGAGSTQSKYEMLDGSTGSDGRFRSVVHIHDYFQTKKTTVVLPQQSNSTVEFRVPYGVTEHLLDVAGPPPFNHPQLTQLEWAEFDRIALEQMLPSMYNGFSFPNFLFELKDFRRLASSVLHRKGRLATAVFGDDQFANARLGQAISSGKLKGKSLQACSKAYLNYSFAWAPLVSDVLKMIDLIKKFERKLQFLLDRAGKPQTRHFSVDLSENPEEERLVGLFGSGVRIDAPESDNISPYHPNWVQLVSRQRQTTPSVYHATCRFHYNTPDIPIHQLRLRAWADAFGIRPDPSIIWNAIPFSFIIDWFVDVGGWLRSFSKDNLGLEIVVEDFCSSQKRETIADYGYVHEHGSDPLNQEDVVYVGTRTSKVYERRASIPATHAVSTIGVPGLKQLTLALALTGARRR